MKALLFVPCLFFSFISAMEADVEQGAMKSPFEDELKKKLSEDDQLLTDYIVSNYFKGQSEARYMVMPYVRKRIRESEDSQDEDQKALIKHLCTMMIEKKIADNKQAELLHTLILDSINEAFKKQNKEIEKRWTKRKSLIIATVASSSMGLATALIVHFAG